MQQGYQRILQPTGLSMRIRCPACSTLYEFDTSSMGHAPINVRCSACSTVFAFDPTDGESPPQLVPQLTVTPWRVLRAGTGERQEVADDRALQRLIIDRRLAPHDLVSQDAVNWQRADTLPLLAEFFDLASRVPSTGSSTSTIGHVSRGAPAVGPPAPVHHPWAQMPASPVGVPGLNAGPLPGVGARTSPQQPLVAIPELGEATATMPGIDDLIQRGESRATTIAPVIQAGTVRNVAAPATTPHQSAGSRPMHQTPSPTTPSSAHEPRPTSPSASATPRPTSPSATVNMESLSQPLPASQSTRPSPAMPPAPGHSPSESPIRRPSQQIISPMNVSGEVVRSAAPAMRMQAVGQKAAPGDRYTLGTAPLSEDDRRTEPSLRAGRQEEDEFDDVGMPRSNRAGVWIALALALAGASGAAWVYRTPILAMMLGVADEGSSAGAGSGESAVTEAPVLGSGDGSAAEGSSADGAVAPSGGAGAPIEGSATAATQGSEAAGDLNRAQGPTEGSLEEASPAAGAPAQPGGEPVRLGADALIERGNRALERGDAEQALEYFGRASELTRSPEPHLGVARSYERMGRLDLAILRYERAIELSPRFAPAWVGLAAARERTGSMNALETWLQVYSMSSDARTRARAEDAIRRLGGTPP